VENLVPSSVVGFAAGLVGRSRRSASIRRLILKVARNRLSVLVLVESGRCEEPVTRAIHAANLPGPIVLLGGFRPPAPGTLPGGRETPNRLDS
jgi:hypothetical protein